MTLIVSEDRLGPNEEPSAVGPVLFAGASVDWEDEGEETYFPIPKAHRTLTGYLGVKDYRFQFRCTDCGSEFSTSASPSINEPVYASRLGRALMDTEPAYAVVICKPCASKRPEEWPDWPA